MCLTRGGSAATVGGMAMAGEGVLAFWHDVVPGGDGEFDRWHLREHSEQHSREPEPASRKMSASIKDSHVHFLTISCGRSRSSMRLLT